MLQTVHEQMGRLVVKYGGTIGYRAGDGVMVIFNDPLPSKDPVRQAIKLALEMKAAFGEIQKDWRELGQSLGLGIGIS
jgi:class 3 adenylate cyclase